MPGPWCSTDSRGRRGSRQFVERLADDTEDHRAIVLGGLAGEIRCREGDVGLAGVGEDRQPSGRCPRQPDGAPRTEGGGCSGAFSTRRRSWDRVTRFFGRASAEAPSPWTEGVERGRGEETSAGRFASKVKTSRTRNALTSTGRVELCVRCATNLARKKTSATAAVLPCARRNFFWLQTTIPCWHPSDLVTSDRAMRVGLSDTLGVRPWTRVASSRARVHPSASVASRSALAFRPNRALPDPVLGGGGRGGNNGRGGHGRGDGGGEGEGGAGGVASPRRGSVHERRARARARSSRAVAAAAAPPSDMGVCFLYGFTWFYGLKLFLKHLFSPILFFLGSMFLLTRMGVLPESLGREAYAAYVEPYVPKEWKDPSLEVVDDWVKTAERKFWAFVRRTLPACNHPVAEKTFFAGIILAGLV